MPESRRHIAVMFTDIVGYTRLMGSDEEKAVDMLSRNRSIHQSCIEKFNGTLIKEIGDGILACFSLASEAVRCAMEIQKEAKDQNIPLKIGIHEGEMIFSGLDVIGDGVNIASRLQEDAQEGCITISGAVYSNIRNKTDIQTSLIGERLYKNVGEYIKVYNVLLNEIASNFDMDDQNKPNSFKEKSIIVLPFVNISPDPDQEYFSDGLTEEIITDLSHIRDLLVISRSSAMTFKGTKKKIREIVDEVNVRYVLEGSVRKAGNNLRIIAQLIDALTDTHLWAEKYNGTLEDIFDIQEKVSQSIVNALKMKLDSLEKKNIKVKTTSNVQLHECYLKAKYEINTWTKASLDRAVRILQNGLKNYGENALLYAALGEAKYLYYDIGAETDKTILNEVKNYAEKALSLKPDIAQGYKLYGLLEMGRGSLIEGYKYMKDACNADPNDPSILMHTAGLIGMYLGKPSFAEPLLKKLLNIDPLSTVNYVFMGFNQYFQGNYKSAIESLQKSFQIDPESPYSIFWLPVFLTANNQKQEALILIDRIIEEGRMFGVFKELTLFIKYVFMCRKTQAINTLGDESRKYTWNDPLFSGLMPGYYSLIHEKEKALDYLNHAINRGFINYPFFSGIDPFLENIRNEEQFKKLMKKVKYEWENFEP